MSQVTVSKGDTVRVVPAELADRYRNRGFDVTPVAPAEDTSELKGAALDEALEAAGLPKTGSAAEKRQRLAEHQVADGQ